jgi:hypothetical protein
MGSMGKSSTRRQSDRLGFHPIFSDCPSSVSWLTLVVGSVHLFRKERVWKSRCSIQRPLQSIRSSPRIDIVSVTSVNLSVCRVLSRISLTCKYRFSRRLLPCFFLILGFWRRVCRCRSFGETYCGPIQALYFPALLLQPCKMETVFYTETTASTNTSPRRQNPKLKKNIK